MVLSARTYIALAAIAAAAFMVISTAFAAPKQGDTRPGWGYGDKNHTHTGPPGQTVRPNNG